MCNMVRFPLTPNNTYLFWDKYPVVAFNTYLALYCTLHDLDNFLNPISNYVYTCLQQRMPVYSQCPSQVFLYNNGSPQEMCSMCVWTSWIIIIKGLTITNYLSVKRHHIYINYGFYFKEEPFFNWYIQLGNDWIINLG